MDKKNLMIGLALGAVAVGITSGIVGVTKGDEIKEWWNETFQKEEKVKYLSVGDELTNNCIIKVDCLKLVDYLKTSKDLETFIDGFNSSISGVNTLDLVKTENGNFNLQTNNGNLYVRFGEDVIYTFEMYNGTTDLYEFLTGLEVINLPFVLYTTVDFEITEIIGLTMDDDVVEEDLKIISIYEESAKEE